MRRLVAMAAVAALSLGGCALDPFDDPRAGDEPTPADQREMERLAAEARADATFRESLLYTAPVGATKTGVWSGYGDYAERRLSYAESFWASTWPPAIVVGDFRQRFPELGWADQPGGDPGEFVIVGKDRTRLVVVYAHPSQPRYVTGADAKRVAGQAPAPAGTQSYVTIVMIDGGADGWPRPPTITVPSSPPS